MERAVLNEGELIVLEMIEHAARSNRPCPSNLDFEMALNCNSASIAPGIVKSLESKGIIRVTRYQRAREVEIVRTGERTAPFPNHKTTRPHVPRGKGKANHAAL